ncbi:MAG: protein-L-isoaspartate O-methyltransferase [Gammaproteobacteria bacterium]|nr:protein-L-isoaspartate O-methyltransferase [Gammaproteobacteria bacterium]
MAKDGFLQLSINGPKGHEKARTNMLKQQIRTWDVLNDKILGLFITVPREEFVPVKYKSLAFADLAIPLGHGQSMMPPREEARILQELKITPADKILLLGIDSGFMLTLLTKLGKHVYYLDNDFDSLDNVKNKIEKYKITNVTPLVGGIYQGWQDYYPFDVILCTGSLPDIPQVLKNALNIQGRLFAVIGNTPAMEAMIIRRVSKTNWDETTIFETERPRILDVKEPETFTF